MTDPKPRARRGSVPIPAETALKKIRALRATSKERQAAAALTVMNDDRKKIGVLFYRVPIAEQDDLHAMLGALGIDVPLQQPTNAGLEEEAPDEDEPASSAPSKFTALVEKAGDPASSVLAVPGDEELPRGAKPYVPSAIAQAARGRR